MKRLLRSITAMATINPQLCANRTIRIEVEQRNEGPIPHLHVYHDNTRSKSKCSYIRLDKVAYSDHHGKDKIVILPRKLKEEFVELMNSPWESYIIQTSNGYRPATWYEAAVKIWEDTFEGGNLDKFPTDENGDIIQLDYSDL